MTRKEPVRASADPLDGPVNADTAVELTVRLGLTQRMAQAILASAPATEDQVHEALKANIHAISAAFSPGTVESIVADPHLAPGIAPADLRLTASRVALQQAAIQKLEALHDDAYAATVVDVGTLERLANRLIKQLRGRLDVEPGLKDTFSALFAYHHARNPGHRAASAPPAPSPAPPTAT